MTIDKTALLPEGLEAARAIFDDRSQPSFRSLEAAITAYLAVQNARPAAGEPVDGADAAAIEIADAVLAWMVKYDLLDADQEYRDDDVIAVLDELSPPSAQGESVAVKALKWGQTSYGKPEAISVAGTYRITDAWDGGYNVNRGQVSFRGDDGRTNFATIEAAKAAAQADFEQRIRSGVVVNGTAVRGTQSGLLSTAETQSLSPAPSLAGSDAEMRELLSCTDVARGLAVMARILGARHE